MQKAEYDFLTWKSFPSSMKITNDTDERGPWELLFINMPIIPGSTLKGTVEVKEKGAFLPVHPLYGLMLYASPDPVERIEGPMHIASSKTPLGTHDWMATIVEKIIPEDRRYLHAYLTGPAGRPGAPMNAWFDNLRVFQDGVLIYENKFSNWAPFIVIPAPIVAGLGVVRFGKKG